MEIPQRATNKGSLTLGHLSKKEVRKLFGKDDPKIDERALTCKKLWDAWKINRIHLKSKSLCDARKILSQNNLYNYRDYVIISCDLRFRNKEDQIWFALAGADLIDTLL